MCRRPTRLSKTMLRLRVESPLQEVTRTRTSQKLIPFHNHTAARQHGIGHTRNLNSLEHRIVNAHMMSLYTDGVLAVRIEDHQVRIADDGDRALARIQTKKLRGSGRNQLYKAVHAESPPGNAARIDQAQAVLNSGTAIRNLCEIIASQLFLLSETEGTVIGRHHLQMIALQSGPEF